MRFLFIFKQKTCTIPSVVEGVRSGRSVGVGEEDVGVDRSVDISIEKH